MIRKLIDPSLHLEEQIKAVRTLPNDLTEGEITALTDLFRQPAPAKTSPAVWYALLNEVMGELGESRFDWNGYSQEMANLVVDRHIDPVVRDYAAQYLAKHMATVTRADDFSSGMEAMISVLRGEREAYESVTGTTLMSLCDLSGKRAAADFEPYRAELGGLITDYASGARPASLANRISAIQTAGRLNIREALPAIRQLAKHGAPNPTIRLNSIASLGYYGDSEDLSFLKELAQSDDKLRFAAKAALKNHSR